MINPSKMFEGWLEQQDICIMDIGQKHWAKQAYETAVKDTLDKVKEIAEELKQDTRPEEDGVPVETYGYEETHNNALDSLLTKLTISHD